ncbi:MAG: MFS transporter, partial [Jatrophihabitans sp.]|uniref:MFS transporter n=1 Tax=Jatrophihabitans sp. TaxID=1932789 RepID=UPI003F7D33EC
MSFRLLPRDVRIIALARSVSWLGDELAVTALLLRFQHEGRPATAVAALLVANLLPVVVLAAPAGRLLDRRENRTLLVGSTLAQAVTCLGLAAADGLPAVLALVALLGAGQAVTGGAWQALLPTAASREQLPAAAGLVQAGVTTAGIAAPPLAGLLVGAAGTGLPLLVDAASFVAVAGLALLLRTRRAGACGAGADRTGAVAIVRADALLATLFVLLGSFVLLSAMVNVADVYLVREVLHASTVAYGVAGSAFAIGMLLGALAAGRARGDALLARLAVVGTTVLAAGLVTSGLAPSVPWLVATGAVIGVGNGVLNVAVAALVMGHAPADQRGRVGALLAGLTSGTALTAFAVGGLLTSALGPRGTFLLAGALGLLVPLAL